MTEPEWLECTDPAPMLAFLKGKAKRKLRLFACACCRRIWHLLPDDLCRRVVEANEQFAERQLQRKELEAMRHQCWVSRSLRTDYGANAAIRSGMRQATLAALECMVDARATLRFSNSD